MINIDESCVNRNLKTYCSWIVKGKSKEVKSIRLSGSLSIVISILNNGAIFTLLSNETIDSFKILIIPRKPEQLDK